jgi:Ca2+-binding RTX toxin-like protein
LPTIDGTSGADTLTGTAGDDIINALGGNDTINATSGTDTVNGGTGFDRLFVQMQDATRFTAVPGAITYNITGGVGTGNGAITSSSGGLNSTLSSVDNIQIFDERTGAVTLNVASDYAGTVLAYFGSGDDTVSLAGTRGATIHLGLGNNTLTAPVGSTAVGYAAVDSLEGFATVGSVGAGVNTVSYTRNATTYTSTLSQVSGLGIETGVVGQGLRVDATGAARSAFFVDSPNDDYIIASLFDDGISEISTSTSVNFSTGVDYKVGNGGADTFDYTVAAPRDFTDHILDLDANDHLDFAVQTGVLGGELIWLGTGAFTHTALEFRYQTGGGNTVIQFDYNGDGNADAAITIDNGEFALENYAPAVDYTNNLRIATAQNFFTGDATVNSLTGSAGADTIRAYDGDDTVRATSGQDFADGGRGTDALNIVMADAGFAAQTGSRTYTIDGDRAYDSSGTLNTSFLNFEQLSLNLSGNSFFNLVNGTTSQRALTVTGGGGTDVIFGSALADTLNGGAGSDLIYASAGADTIDGGSSSNDKIQLDSSNSAALFLTPNADNYTITANKLTNGAATLNSTFTSVERVDIYDYRPGNSTVDASAFGGRVTFLQLGDGNHTVIGSNVAGDNIKVGIGSSTIDGGTNGNGSALIGTASTAAAPVIVGGTSATVVGGALQPDGTIQGGTYTPSQLSFSYSSGGTGYVTTLTNALPWVFSGNTSGLHVDASNAPLSYSPNTVLGTTTYYPFGVSLIDSLYDDVEIGSRYADRFSMANEASATVNGGTDYMTGGGGADIYDYEAALNLARNDYILDFDADDQISFSYFGTGTEPHFIGTAAFSHTAREIRYETHDGHTYIQADVDGDGVADGTVTIVNGEHALKGIDYYGLGNGTNDTLMLDETQNISGGGNAPDALNGTAATDILRGYDGNDTLSGFAGNDTLDGGTGNDLILTGIGTDTALGGDGNDGIVFGAYLDASDSVDGGTGTNDQVGIQGDYSGGLTLGANNLTNTEALVLISGADTRFGDLANNFYDYNLTTIDANVTAGQLFVVNANTLRAGEDFTFNGSAETDGSFLTYGGGGVDTITGGQQVDGFYFGGSNFGAGDSLNGGGGNDQLGLQGSYTAVFGAGQLISIEAIILLSGADTRFGGGGLSFSYNLTMNDGNVAAGASMIINGNTLRAGETLTFNGSAESDGRFSVFSGAGDDTITGGAGNDAIYGGAGSDTMTGGAGLDTFVYLNAAHSANSASDHITDFSSGDLINLSAIDANTGTGANDAFSFIGSGAFTHTAGELRAALIVGSNWGIVGDLDGDGAADFTIYAVTDHALTAADFVL